MKKAFKKFVKKLPIDFIKERKYDSLIKKDYAHCIGKGFVIY